MNTDRLEDINEVWDLLIIGGGITGAGIFHEAVRMGLKTLLLEQKDFAWGTSSRSSKLVHGGLRYLKEGKFFLTKIAVEEREFLLLDAPGLVEPLTFFLPVYENQRPGKRLLGFGLSIYDLMAREKQHHYYNADDFAEQVPLVLRKGLQGGFHYTDAQVDDARLVLRLIQEALSAGGRALNYTAVTAIQRDADGNLQGVTAQDTETGKTRDFSARAVINATGCWAEKLHPSPDAKRHLRPLRGSHLVFPAHVLPLDSALGFMHPEDNRSLFIIPWEGAVLIGTTDLDHPEDLALEPKISDEEISYLLQGARAVFPSLDLSLDNCISAYAGVRPVLSENDDLAPSEESREHVVWVDRGLVTITGGKLTTFRRLAWDALKAARPFLPQAITLPGREAALFSKTDLKPPKDTGISLKGWERLCGRYGSAAETVLGRAAPQELETVSGTRTLWAEIPYAAGHERIRHLDDLLLRRVRIGLLTRSGGLEHLKRIRDLCEKILPWDHPKWEEEIARYSKLWRDHYALPGQGHISSNAKWFTGFIQRIFFWSPDSKGNRPSPR